MNFDFYSTDTSDAFLDTPSEAHQQIREIEKARAKAVPAMRARARSGKAATSTDFFELAGDPHTEDGARAAVKARLAGLVEHFYRLGHPDSDDVIAHIGRQTREASHVFLANLPSDVPLPKIAPDGDEGLVMVWEHGGRVDLVTIDGWNVYTVANAGTMEAVYDTVQLPPTRIPASVVNVIRRV